VNFDYTYIALGDFLIFEPLIIVSNSIFLALCLRYCIQLRRFGNAYGTHMGNFLFWMGIGSIFGAVCHSVHYQLGVKFFLITLYLMNACSLLSIYFCFIASQAYVQTNVRRAKAVRAVIVLWVLALLVAAAIYREFLLIKIHAALVMIFTLVVHIIMLRRSEWQANLWFIWGIAISFLSVIVHSMKLSLHEWFNYKDLAHVFMIIALMVMFRGMKGISGHLSAGQVQAAQL
jgi:hypothetical protein